MDSAPASTVSSQLREAVTGKGDFLSDKPVTRESFHESVTMSERSMLKDVMQSSHIIQYGLAASLAYVPLTFSKLSSKVNHSILIAGILLVLSPDMIRYSLGFSSHATSRLDGLICTFTGISLCALAVSTAIATGSLSSSPSPNMAAMSAPYRSQVAASQIFLYSAWALTSVYYLPLMAAAIGGLGNALLIGLAILSLQSWVHTKCNVNDVNVSFALREHFTRITVSCGILPKISIGYTSFIST